MGLDRCLKCGGFLTRTSMRCPHCGRGAGSARSLFFAAAAASSTIVACACYGVPPCEDGVNLGPCMELSDTEEPAPDSGISDGGGDDAGIDAGTADAGDGGI